MYSMEHWWNDNSMWKPTELLGGETCPVATLFIKGPAWKGLKLNPTPCGVKLATNLMSHGTAFSLVENQKMHK